jgi:hypothetical protein
MANGHHFLVSVQYTACLGAGADVTIDIDLVELGDEACPALKHEPMAFGEAFVASMPDLWRLKAMAFVVNRPGEKEDDRLDFEWLTRQMVATSVEYDPVELWEMMLDGIRAKPRRPREPASAYRRLT